jgi:hypothetical protein
MTLTSPRGVGIRHKGYYILKANKNSDISITMNRYSHVTPTMQKEAAAAIANPIHK